MGSSISLEKSGGEPMVMADASPEEGRKTRQFSLQRDIATVTSACEACPGVVTGEAGRVEGSRTDGHNSSSHKA